MSIFTYKKLYQAYLDCRRTKRNTINALNFEYNLEENILKLQSDLVLRQYKPGRLICFAVKEPVREIFASDFRDRVIHHLLIREINDLGERIFIHDSYACRKNKGTHRAVKRLDSFIRQTTKNYKNKAYYMQLDISGFFMAINHKKLYNIVEKLVFKYSKSVLWQDEILWLAKVVIFARSADNCCLKGDINALRSIPKKKSLFNSGYGKGMPIGNYTSQFFANLYLNKLDQFVKRELKGKYYLRYVDDFILLDENIDKLKLWKNKINIFLKNELGLNLHDKKTKIQEINKGIDFLGYFLKPGYMLVRNKVVKRFKNKINNFSKDNKKKNLAVINSYLSHFKHADSYSLINSYKNSKKALLLK